MTVAEQPQHERARARANEVRYAMADVRRGLADLDGLARAAAHLREPSEVVARMRVGHLLTGIRRVGPGRAARLLDEAGVGRRVLEQRVGDGEGFARYRGKTHSVRTLSARQRQALADVLDAASERR